MKDRQALQNNWIVSRGGFLNYWSYDNEIFEFKGGNLLLKGQNASGKSVTMNAFIPLLLDGNKSPERLDPFGTRSRKMIYYLLGNTESGREDETAYVFLEFKRKYTNNYITIGMGLRARKGNPTVDAWHFIIKDGKRIGKDFFLYSETSEGIEPLSKKAFIGRLRDGGEIHDSSADYMKAVNKELFGFENIDDFSQLISLLIQIRSPKLNKDFEPKDIAIILNQSLDTISQEDLRLVAESLQEMDNIEESIKNLEKAIKVGGDFKSIYSDYNQYVLWEKASKFFSAYKKVKEKVDEIQSKKKTLNELTLQLKEVEKKIEVLNREHEIAREIEVEYRDKDIWKDSQKLDGYKANVAELKSQLKNKIRKIEINEGEYRDLENNIKEIKHEINESKRVILDDLKNMGSLASEVGFDTHEFELERFSFSTDREPNLKGVAIDARKYKKDLQLAKKKIEIVKALRKEYDSELERLDKLRDKLNELQREEKKAKDLLNSLSQGFIDAVCKWRQNNFVLNFRSEIFPNLLSAINQYISGENYYIVDNKLREEVNYKKDQINYEISEFKFQQNKIKEEIERKTIELNQLKEQKEVIPKRTIEVLKNRERLKNKGIPFISFYEAVDFQDELQEEEKSIIEASLSDMGLLDALIIPSEHLNEALNMDKDMHDKYIISSPNYMCHELSQKLKVVKPHNSMISSSLIGDVISSILLTEENGKTYMDSNRTFGIGLIQGKTSNQYLAKFIGVSNRRRYKEETIEKLSSEIEELKSIRFKKQEEINALEEKLRLLDVEVKSFPSNEEIEEIKKMIMDLEVATEGRGNEVEERQCIIKRLYRNLSEAIKEQNQLTKRFSLPNELEDFENAIEAIDEYIDALNNLIRNYDKYNGYNERLTAQISHLEDKDSVLYDLRYEVSNLERKKDNIDLKIEELEKLLKESDFEAINAKIVECTRIINGYPQRNNSLNTDKTKAEMQMDRVKEDIVRLNEEIIDRQKEEYLLKNTFIQENNLLLVVDEEINESIPIEEVINLCIHIVKGYEFKDKTKDKAHYERLVSNKYYDINQDLIDYNLRFKNIGDVEICEQDSDEIVAIKRDQRRVLVEGRIEGKYVEFYKLIKEIKLQLDEKKYIFTQENANLAKKLLTRDISGKINAKIYRSKAWTKKIDDLLKSLSVSDDLTFSIVWESKKGVGNQMHTKELEEIFKGDHRLLSEESLEKLSNHFKSKIDEIRLEMQMSDMEKSYSEIIQEILDYRNWFEFKLYYTRKGESRHELTKQHYGTFSGGEKALSAYAPLFTAIHALYEKADSQCLRILTLDEAFAGVSDDNINKMFQLIYDLNLTYIFNSEKISGTYSSIKELSICELIKDINENAVGIIHYVWNGKKKIHITDELRVEDIEMQEVALTKNDEI